MRVALLALFLTRGADLALRVARLGRIGGDGGGDDGGGVVVEENARDVPAWSSRSASRPHNQ